MQGTTTLSLQNSLFGCVVNRSQSNTKFKSSGLHAFGWQVYSGIKINQRRSRTPQRHIMKECRDVEKRHKHSLLYQTDASDHRIRLPPLAFRGDFFFPTHFTEKCLCTTVGLDLVAETNSPVPTK